MTFEQAKKKYGLKSKANKLGCYFKQLIAAGTISNLDYVLEFELNQLFDGKRINPFTAIKKPLCWPILQQEGLLTLEEVVNECDLVRRSDLLSAIKDGQLQASYAGALCIEESELLRWLRMKDLLAPTGTNWRKRK